MSRVIILGLDGASFDFLMPWIKDGKLPVFQSALKDGCHGIISSTIPSITCPALPTIYTGMNPGNTGIFSFENPDGTIVSSSDIDYKPIWEILTDNGKRSLISNLRTTYPPEHINGIMICNLHAKLAEKSGLNSWENSESSWVYPNELEHDLEGWAIDYDHFLNEIRNKILDKNPDGIENVRNLVKLRARKFIELLMKDHFDFAFHWIEHTDTLNHLSWGNKEIILQFYQNVIEPIIAEIRDTFSDDNIIIISDHGAAEQSTKNLSINTWLRDNGYLSTNRLSNYFYSMVKPMVSKMRRRIPQRNNRSRRKNSTNQNGENTIGEKILFPNLKKKMFMLDWNKTLAYSSLGWGIHLNKHAKNGHDEICGQLINKLKHLNDENGLPIFSGVWKRDEIYFGKYASQIPEIIFLPRNDLIPTRDIGKTLLQNIPNPPQIGKHNFARNALFLGMGPDIAQNKQIDRHELYDIMPTILFMMHQRIPRKLDGKVMKDIFSEHSNYSNSEIDYSDEDTLRTDKKIRNLTKVEEASMREMLKGLGYLD